MRILKGYSKDEQNELKEFKKTLDITDLLHIITGLAPDTGCGLIWRRYDKAGTDERISIIKDILDFYTGKAKFAEQKYYLHFIKNDESSYLNINPNGGAKLYNSLGLNGWKVKFTIDEIAKINPQFVPFMEEVEDY